MVAADSIQEFERAEWAARRKVAAQIAADPEKAKAVAGVELGRRTRHWHQQARIGWRVVLETCETEEIARLLTEPRGPWEEKLAEAHPFRELLGAA